MRRSVLFIIGILLATATSSAMVQAQVEQLPRLQADAVITSDNYRLPLTQWLPDGEPCRVVLALHGFNDYRKTFANLASHLTRDCTAVYAYDHRGFGATADRGQWPGRARLVNDATTVARLLRERYPTLPLYIAGESMGGAITMLTLTQAYPPPVDGAILLAPAVWARQVQPWYQRAALWLGIRLIPEVKIPNDLVSVDPSDDPEVLEYWHSHPMVIQRSRIATLYGIANLMDAALAAADQLQHTLLVLYGGKDEVIPREATCLFVKQLRQSSADWRFVYYPGGYHALTRYSGEDQTINDIQAWLESPEAALPSGRQLLSEQAESTLCE